jgi:hypothetical protein
MPNPEQPRMLAPRATDALQQPIWQVQRRGTLAYYQAEVKDSERTYLHQAKLITHEHPATGTSEPLAFDYFYLDGQHAFGVQMRHKDFTTGVPSAGLATTVSQQEHSVPGEIPAERHFLFDGEGYLQRILADDAYYDTRLISEALTEMGYPEFDRVARREERSRLVHMAERMGFCSPQHRLNAVASIENLVQNIASSPPSQPTEQMVFTLPGKGER